MWTMLVFYLRVAQVLVNCISPMGCGRGVYEKFIKRKKCVRMDGLLNIYSCIYTKLFNLMS